MAQQDLVDTPRLTLIVGSGTLITIATIFAVQALFHWGEQQAFIEKNDATQPRELTQVRAHGAEMLTKYGVANHDKQRYVIPIERAMQLMSGK